MRHFKLSGYKWIAGQKKIKKHYLLLKTKREKTIENHDHLKRHNTGSQKTDCTHSVNITFKILLFVKSL